MRPDAAASGPRPKAPPRVSAMGNRTDMKGSTMPFFTQVGEFPRKRHTVFRRPDGGLYWEELIGEDGFSGDTSLLYHRNPPSALTSIEAVATTDDELVTNDPMRPLHLR